jgi:Rrf2 family protein
MKLGQGVEWAAHICSVLAVAPKGSALPAARCAEFYDLPRAYLSKNLRQLVAAGVLTATPGPAGGYALARPAAEITLRDIVEAIEGRGWAFRCTEIRQRGPTGLSADCYPGRCGIARAMRAAEEAWRAALEQTTVADLVATARREVPREQQERTRAWLSESLKDGYASAG